MSLCLSLGQPSKMPKPSSSRGTAAKRRGRGSHSSKAHGSRQTRRQEGFVDDRRPDSAVDSHEQENSGEGDEDIEGGEYCVMLIAHSFQRSAKIARFTSRYPSQCGSVPIQFRRLASISRTGACRTLITATLVAARGRNLQGQV